jgi:hypothetical protein
MKLQDPYSLIWSQVPDYDCQKIETITVVYLTAEDRRHVEQLAASGQTFLAMRYATRAFKYRPDLGDHDRGPEKIESQASPECPK